MFTSSEDSKRVSEATAIERLKHTNRIKVGFDLCVPEESTRQEFKLVTFPEKTQSFPLSDTWSQLRDDGGTWMDNCLTLVHPYHIN